MTKITLRSYNREIEVITDQGKIDFAVAHCLHILKFFPKHVDTYRLLGKTYLENQRLGDAADVFQRVLSAVPDDFVSHIGMSIIREDEGNLDAAIWHMQRAYDVQSANITIQDELRRLYDRRDGVEPPKIRLTRAALARMYARGDLVTEAIAELRAALQEEPERVDLQVLLARMYATNQQRVKSIQTCSQVLGKLPYCLEANLIIAKALEETNRFDEAQPYLERARELEPYAAFLSDQAPTVDLVPDAAVTLLKLDESELRSYAAAAATQPAWVTTLGGEISEQTEAEEDIDWLLEEPAAPPKSLPPADDFVYEDLAADLAASAAFGTGAASRGEDLTDDGETEPAELDLEDLALGPEDPDIPDWMVEAGWETGEPESTGPTETPEPDMFETAGPERSELEEDPDDSGLYRARIPDWLQALAPADPETGETDQAVLEELPQVYPPAEAAEDPAATGEEIPDWLKDMDRFETAAQAEVSPAQSEEAIPDWLASIGPAEPEDTISEPEAQPAEDIPDWLREMAAQAETSTSLTEGDPEDRTGVTLWLERNAGRTPVEPESEKWRDTVGPESEEWSEMELPTDEPIGEPADAGDFSEMGDDEAMRWLESLAAKQGAGEEELLTAPEDRTDTPPEWVQALGAPAPDEAVFEADAGKTFMESEPPDDGSDWAEIEEAVEDVTAVTASGPSDSMDWLESLGEEPAAEGPGFISQPEEAVEETPGWNLEDTSAIDADDLPDWLKDQIGEAPETAPSTAMPSWLQEMDLEAVPDEGVEMAEPADDVPEWLQDIASGEAETAAGDIPDWLQQTMIAPSPFERSEPAVSDAAETVIEETGVEETIEAPEAEPAPVMDAEEDSVPAWLREMVRAEEENEPAEAEADIPDWLQQTMLAPMPMAEPAGAVEDVPETVIDEPDVQFEMAGELEETYAWEQETFDFETDEAESAAESGAESAAEPVMQEMEEAPAVEMDEEEKADKWWERDTGEFERPVFPAEEAVDEMAPETVVEWPDEPVAEPAMEMALEEPAPEPAMEMAFEEPAPEPDMAPEQLEEAREALRTGNLETAIAGYRSLIRSKSNLSEVIADLQRALEYDHPVNIDIWATLGDAYAGKDNLQNALDAYTKAEELLR